MVFVHVNKLSHLKLWEVFFYVQKKLSSSSLLSLQAVIFVKSIHFDTPTGGRLAGWTAGRLNGWTAGRVDAWPVAKRDIKANSA